MTWRAGASFLVCVGRLCRAVPCRAGRACTAPGHAARAGFLLIFPGEAAPAAAALRCDVM
jgi:hypothetical protein